MNVSVKQGRKVAQQNEFRTGNRRTSLQRDGRGWLL